MRKEKEQEYNPNEYWKEKKFDSNEEFLIYRYLCGNLGNKNKIKKEKRFREYKSWREHVEGIIKEYNKEELSEFLHFVKLRRRQCDIDIGMHTSIFIPLFVAIAASLLVGGILELIKNPSMTTNVPENYNPSFLLFILCVIVMFIFMIVITLGLGFIFYNVINPYIKSKNETSFWVDCSEVVEEYIEKNEEKNNREER